MSRPITVIKRNILGEETWRYTGVLMRHSGTELHLEAHFNGPDTPLMGTVIRSGDRFIETYYLDRWYNFFEIHDRDDDLLKGWYCNIGKPAIMEAEDVLSYVDLELDLWVAPDGSQTVLDEDEFAALELDTQTRFQAKQALNELKRTFKNSHNSGLP
jgi:uncharacterized protein